MQLPHNSAILHLGIHPRERKTYTYTRSSRKGGDQNSGYQDLKRETWLRSEHGCGRET